MNVIDIVREQIAAYDAGKSFAVVTITGSDGSTTRSNGKMIVFEDGSTKGTIGGGAVKLMAICDAKKCIQERTGKYCSYDLTTPASEAGMTCGGCLSVMIESFAARPLLVMCGAGHVGGEVLKLASYLGFSTLLVDDRKEEVIAEKIALADRFVQVKDFEEDLKNITFPEDTFVVIAAHGHAFDGAALAGVIEKNVKYIGMIGGPKKINALFAKLREKGVKQEKLDNVYAPVGLDLGGETPEEIAFSIMSEVLMKKNGRTGGHLIGMEV